ncbi:SusC/RagA family TonB-linked outer membrane protein [Cecembia sp.]|uniref:SusC/RagA family TonB-linked outer membrane protein n=2 Tax=Cecembia sp. TaxID=1898110 RepID=UPI0025BA5DC1|nr:SusC/RagA family TonB-linked outer membrane protein [Cecembia sp.]
MKVFLSLLTCFLLISMSATLAQTRIVKGQVFSKKDNSPISGASIILKGTAIGTATDLDGRYVLQVNRDDFTLVFSYFGYQPQEVIFGEENDVDVYLVPLEEAEEARVPVQLPAEPKKDKLKSPSELIENIPFQSFDRALQGRIPGLLIRTATGIPGGNINARIRGVGSIFAGNEPLYVVDGVLLNNVSSSLFTQSNPLAFLNPNEIESIEVLRDAASTAIYGNQGGNGVILVTTKKGNPGKLRIGLNAYVGQNIPIKFFDVLDGPEWYMLRRDAFNNSNATSPEARALSNMGILPENWNQLSSEELDAIGMGLPTYDWQSEMMGRSMLHNYELNASGGTESTQYYVSGSYHYSGSTFAPVDFERGTIRASLTQKIGERIQLEANANLANIGQNVPFSLEGPFLGNPAFASSTILSHNAIFNEDGSFNEQIGGLASQNIALVRAFNSGKTTSNMAVGNFAVNYTIAEGLNYRGTVGVDYRDQEEFRFRDPRTPDGSEVNGRNTVANHLVERYMTHHRVDWSKAFENSVLNVYAGYEYLTENRENIRSEATNINTPGLDNFLTGSVLVFSDTLNTGYKRQGAYLGMNFELGEKYLIDLGTRMDGGSRFGSNYRYGFFPFVKLGWQISNEGGLRDSESVSLLRLRASWGMAGNDQIGDFSWMGFYGQGNSYAGEPGIRVRAFENPNLRWETNETINVGLDFGFVNDKITGGIDVFERNTRGLLLNFPIALDNSNDLSLRNVGGLRNRGIELSIQTMNLQRGSFSWYSGFNFSYIKNEVTSLYDGLLSVPQNPRWAVGQPVGNPAFPGQTAPGAWYLAEYTGVNPANGRPMWLDINGNRTYLPTNNDRVYFGSNFPPYFGGLSNTFKIKGFELTTFFTYEYGAVVSDGQYNFLRDNGNRFTFNALREINDRAWKAPGDMTDIPRDFALSGGEAARSQIRNFGTASLLKADFIRLSQLKIAYVFDPTILQNIGLQQASIYAQGINLWTYTDYPGYDPEFMGSGVGQIPIHKSYNIGVQLSF